jgi:3'-phosphoadenosine 5'-phosphosulfate sulfotransferase (PAPS reductase)/FAD synthetase
MTKIVNLNKYRKQKAKIERTKHAETNRRIHGRTKAERARELLQKQRQQALLDGARLEQKCDVARDDDRG